jgi:hypothetical protein
MIVRRIVRAIARQARNCPLLPMGVVRAAPQPCMQQEGGESNNEDNSAHRASRYLLLRQFFHSPINSSSSIAIVTSPGQGP